MPLDDVHALRIALAKVGASPGMYLRSSSFDTAVAYLDGYDAGTKHELLLGFREWLVVRVGAGNNLVWWELARELLGRQWPTEATEAQRIGRLFSIVDEFLAERGASDGALSAILQAHADWVHAQTAEFDT